jgi:hypothetical protein
MKGFRTTTVLQTMPMLISTELFEGRRLVRAVEGGVGEENLRPDGCSSLGVCHIRVVL